ncbi:MAG: NAD(P)-binding domain-containing protein [bacterium]
MKVGVLGSGDVGRVLGAGFVSFGHDVKLGSRDPHQEKLKAWAKAAGAKASTGTFAEAAAFGDVLVLATAWSGTESALKLADAKNFAGKVVLDATNPLDMSTMPPGLAVGPKDSAGERVQRWLPGARVVKAFNSVGNAHMVRPSFPGGPPDMPICGNDAKAKETATKICRDFGWNVIDLGGIESSRYLEPLAMVWILHYFATKSPNHAFKLLTK